jgi:hypothetical protein
MTEQETLEEAADLWSIDTNNVHPADSYIAKAGFIEGAKWQQQNSYSEEDMIAFLDWSKSTNQEKSEYELKCLLSRKVLDSKVLFSIWFEQFKKK